jgi:hypothetical protein
MKAYKRRYPVVQVAQLTDGARAGDYVIEYPDGKSWIVEKATFERNYAPADTAVPRSGGDRPPWFEDLMAELKMRMPQFADLYPDAIESVLRCATAVRLRWEANNPTFDPGRDKATITNTRVFITSKNVDYWKEIRVASVERAADGSYRVGCEVDSMPSQSVAPHFADRLVDDLVKQFELSFTETEFRQKARVVINDHLMSLPVAEDCHKGCTREWAASLAKELAKEVPEISPQYVGRITNLIWLSSHNLSD